MRKIIGGIAYDTTKADLVHDYSNGYSHSDFKFCEEDLYRTRGGRWFLHGCGGALSKYAEPCDGNSYCSGSDLTPLSEDEAREWLEGHAPAEVYEQHFKVQEA